ncbi:apoptosis facilitator Bcl-2-like protein 14 isoform X2 [Hoplias malabaricus]|uniref:apoptosis facilitator Bcl-2-like protein 14 isoform X2 n=1 Tax=Hoplias malabaricus TaxID=27720 RepID=UPI0034619142
MDATDMEFSTEYRLLEAYYIRTKDRARLRVNKPKVVPMCGAASKASYKMSAPGVLVYSQGPGATEGLDDVADTLTCIVDHNPQDSFESDSPVQNDVIQRLVALLKETGDDLNRKIQKDHELLGYLQKSFSYSMFESLILAFMKNMVPASRQNKETTKQKVEIAWTFEVTSRLRALELQPMNRIIGFGAQYLHMHFAPWIQQHGGWEKVFNSDESDDEVQ